MDLDSLTLGQAKQLGKLYQNLGDTPERMAQDQDFGIQIVVLDRGFVYVGDTQKVGDFILIQNAQNIRLWGTSKGLGELYNGPLSNTKLDPTGTVRAPYRALIALIAVDESKWAKSLSR